MAKVVSPRIDGTDDLRLLTVEECAALLAVSGEAVRAHVRHGRLRAFRLGSGPKSRIRIESGELARFLRDTCAPTVETR
jgi:excisionase family DNA binding protein